jgi:hypothetical protein
MLDVSKLNQCSYAQLFVLLQYLLQKMGLKFRNNLYIFYLYNCYILVFIYF